MLNRVISRTAIALVVSTAGLADRTIHAWFNTADFVSPGNYIFGNSGRNILAEALNVLNTPQFNNPNAQIGSAAAGTITSAGAPLLFQRTSREIQLALKLYW